MGIGSGFRSDVHIGFCSGFCSSVRMGFWFALVFCVGMGFALDFHWILQWCSCGVLVCVGVLHWNRICIGFSLDFRIGVFGFLDSHVEVSSKQTAFFVEPECVCCVMQWKLEAFTVGTRCTTVCIPSGCGTFHKVSS